MNDLEVGKTVFFFLYFTFPRLNAHSPTLSVLWKDFLVMLEKLSVNYKCRFRNFYDPNLLNF